MPYHTIVTDDSANRINLKKGFKKAFEIATANKPTQLAIVVEQARCFDTSFFEESDELKQMMDNLKKNGKITLRDDSGVWLSIHLLTAERMKRMNYSGFSEGIAFFMFSSANCLEETVKKFKITDFVYCPAYPTDLAAYLSAHSQSISL